MNPELSTRSSCFGSSTHTAGLTGDVRQARQAACQFGQATIGEQLMDGCRFSGSPCGGHGYCTQQSAAAGTDGAQNRTLAFATNCLQ